MPASTRMTQLGPSRASTFASLQLMTFRKNLQNSKTGMPSRDTNTDSQRALVVRAKMSVTRARPGFSFKTVVYCGSGSQREGLLKAGICHEATGVHWPSRGRGGVAAIDAGARAQP